MDSGGRRVDASLACLRVSAGHVRGANMAVITARPRHWVLRAIAPLILLLAGIGVAPPAAAAVTLPPGSITVPDSGTFLYMYSEPGDYIGQGVEQLYTSN